jgi:hypothetical protein
MAPVAKLYRLVFGGRLFDKEGWSCSLNIGSPTGFNLAASVFAPPIQAWVNASLNLSSAAKLDFIKSNEIDPLTGRYMLQNATNELIQNDQAIGKAAPGPGQLSVVVSTRTAQARGRAHAGRFYPPTGTPTIDPLTGLISASTANLYASQAWTMITGINTILATAGSVVVFSKVGQSIEPVTGVRVGRVVDTMRSRRRALTEDYSYAPI